MAPPAMNTAEPGRRKKQPSTPTTSDDDKFPTGQMITLAICKFSEPIAFNSVIAYTYPMAQWLHAGDDYNASFYAGLLVSAYAFGEVFTAVLWGYISDRVGRKPVVLFGLGGVALSCVMFGLAKNFWVALAARLIGGMLNGNVAVMQTMLAEMVKRPEHEPTAYAIHPFVWFAGGILGSAMGGYLAKPAHYYPHLFSPDGLFAEYPFLLPNLVCVVAIVIAVIQGMIFLKETNPHTAERERQKAKKRPNAPRVSEATPLLIKDTQKQPITTITPLSGSNSSSSTSTSTSTSNSTSTSTLTTPTSQPPQPYLLESSLPSSTDPHFDLRRSSFGTMHSITLQPPLHETTTASSTTPPKPSLRTTFNPTVTALILSLVLCSYHSMGYFNLLPIYLLSPPSEPSISHPHLDLTGGLSYDLHAVGAFMACNGLISLLVQGLVFPPLVATLGVYRSFLFCILLYPFTYPLIPLLTLLPAGPSRSAGVYAVMIIQNHLNIIIPPCALILIKNATPSPLVLGTVNGACMSLLSAARTVAPPVVGWVYSQGGSGMAWASLAGVAVVGVVQVWWVPMDLGRVEVKGLGRDEEAVVEDEEEMAVVEEEVEEVRL